MAEYYGLALGLSSVAWCGCAANNRLPLACRQWFESHCCHVNGFRFLSLQNAMRGLVTVSSGFRAQKVTAFRLGLEIWACSAEPGLQDEIKTQRLDVGMALLQVHMCVFL